MFSGEKTQLPEGAVFFSAIIAWLLSAAIFLVLATFAANLAGMGEQGMGILSSLLSFLCAAAAGWAAAKRQRKSGLLTVLFISAALIVLLLTVGFLTGGKELNPSPILSLVSFTFSGVLFGAMVLYRPQTVSKKSTRFVRKLT